MSSSSARLLARIGALQTLIENFPMGIFEMGRGKRYTNALEFIIDALRMLGLSERELLDKIFNLFFDVPNAVELYTGIGGFSYKKIAKPTDEQKNAAILVDKVPENAGITIESPYYIYVATEKNGRETRTYYTKKTKGISKTNSAFLENIEGSIKSVIANTLTGVLSCSIAPEIPDENLDVTPITINPIRIPSSVLDPFNLLAICPTNSVGRHFYSVEEELSSSELYKTMDLNAFIWFVLNKGSVGRQIEVNKMMWDSRMSAANESLKEYQRNTPEEWNNWVNSKETDDGLLYTDGLGQTYINAHKSGETINLPLHPILQLGYDGDALTAKISKQTYFGEEGNKTIYKFNDDYLRNIKILSTDIIFANMLESVLNGNLTGPLKIETSWLSKEIETRVEKALMKAVEVDDMTVSDCFFSFSNEDYEDMLRNYEMQRYGGISLNSDASSAMKINSGYSIDVINEMNSMATSEGKVGSIKRTAYEIATLPSEDSSVSVTDKGGVGANTQWIVNIVMALMKPIIKAIVSPQVMLLFAINFQIMGLINLEDGLAGNKVLTLVFKKLVTIIVGLAEMVKDRIIKYLTDLFEELVWPLIIKATAVMLRENLEDWIELLEEALACLPSFNFTKQRVLGQIDDVTYADITTTQTTPESSTNC